MLAGKACRQIFQLIGLRRKGFFSRELEQGIKGAGPGTKDQGSRLGRSGVPSDFSSFRIVLIMRESAQITCKTGLGFLRME